MSLTLQIIDEFVGLLKNRGYDEQSLDNPARPGLIADQLSAKIRTALHESLTWNENTAFEFKTFGYFDGFPNPVFFTMKFEFDIEKCSLDIAQLVAKYGNHERAFILKKSYDLPESKVAASLLLTQTLSRKYKGNSRKIDEGKKGLGL